MLVVWLNYRTLWKSHYINGKLFFSFPFSLINISFSSFILFLSLPVFPRPLFEGGEINLPRCFHALLFVLWASGLSGHMTAQQSRSVWPVWWTFLGRFPKQASGLEQLVHSNMIPGGKLKCISCCCQCPIYTTVCQILTSFKLTGKYYLLLFIQLYVTR